MISAHESAVESFVFAGSLFTIFNNCFCPAFTIYYVVSLKFFIALMKSSCKYYTRE